jgi:hypothetical protein
MRKLTFVLFILLAVPHTTNAQEKAKPWFIVAQYFGGPQPTFCWQLPAGKLEEVKDAFNTTSLVVKKQDDYQLTGKHFKNDTETVQLRTGAIVITDRLGKRITLRDNFIVVDLNFAEPMSLDGQLKDLDIDPAKCKGGRYK